MGWMNNDELYIKYGTDRATPGVGGEYNVLGGLKWIEADIDLTTLPDIADIATEKGILSDVLIVPKNVIIEKVVIVVTEVTAGTNANFNLGLVKNSDRSTAIDADGLVVAADGWHEGAVGTITEYTQGSDDHGALVGTTVGTDVGLLTAHYDTAAFTDGTLKVRVYWRVD